MGKKGGDERSAARNGCDDENRRVCQAGERSATLLPADVGETRHAPAVGEGDAFDEHRLRPDPETMVAVEHLIDDEDFLRLRMAGEMVHAILVALVVAVAAGARLGGEGWEGDGHVQVASGGPTWVILSLGK